MGEQIFKEAVNVISNDYLSIYLSIVKMQIRFTKLFYKLFK